MASGAQPGSLVPPRTNSTLGVIPGLRAPDGPKVEQCHVDTHYDLITAAVCSVYIIFGVLYTFCGYRCFKTVMFLTGFIFASSIVYLICLQGELMPPYGNAGVAIFAGILFGLITMLVQYVGLFMEGLHTGLLLGLGGLLAADHIMETSPRGSVWMCVGVLLASALLMAIFNLYFRKGLTVLGTSIYGGAIVTASIDYFVERLSMVAWLWERVSLRPAVPPPCWYSWIVLGTWPTLVLLGLVIQCAVTGRGTYHDDGAPPEEGPRRGPGECSTLQSDATHLTILPDANMAVLTESEDDSQTEIPTQR